MTGGWDITRRTVLLTRPLSAAGPFEQTLAARGVSVMHQPFLDITQPDDWSEADRALDALGVYTAVLFTSVNAVRFFMARVRSLGVAPADVPPVYVVGEKTAAAAREEGLDIAGQPAQANGAALADALGDVSNQFFLQPGSQIARDDTARIIEARGGRLHSVVVYHTVSATPSDLRELDRLFVEGAIDCVAFFSPSAVRAFTTVIPDFKQATVLVAVIGQTTAAAALGSGLRVDIIAPEQTGEAFAEAIAARLDSEKKIELDPDLHMDIG
ncbi:MAG: uroporphyrinogen-III synthase [Ignavibacteriae bacterium]|nr:uroporphyrinogen-III synthase [Ignavibacteriota bacterium]